MELRPPMVGDFLREVQGIPQVEEERARHHAGEGEAHPCLFKNKTSQLF